MILKIIISKVEEELNVVVNEDEQVMQESLVEAEEENLGFLSSLSKVDLIPKVSPVKRRKTLALKSDRTEAEEAELSTYYNSMTEEERAFSILADLNMVSIHADPDDPEYDDTRDDDFCDDYFVDLLEAKELGVADSKSSKIMGKITKFNAAALKKAQAKIASGTVFASVALGLKGPPLL